MYRESAIVEAHPHAMYCLATLLRPSQANDPEESWDARMYWLQTAAVLHGHPYAIREFCDAFALGEGILRNPNEAAYYRQRLAEYGRFRIERDLDVALRNAEANGLANAESAFMLAWFQSVTGADGTDSLRLAVEKGHAGAMLTLAMNALATTDDLTEFPNVLDMAFTGKKTKRETSHVDGPLITKQLERDRVLKSEVLHSGAHITARKVSVLLKADAAARAITSRHVNALAELSAKSYWPAILCSIALRLFVSVTTLLRCQHSLLCLYMRIAFLLCPNRTRSSYSISEWFKFFFFA